MVFTPNEKEYFNSRTAKAVEALATLITAAGRLPVDASGLTLTADMVQADMEQVTGAGAAAKTLADVVAIITANLKIPTVMTCGVKTVAAAATPEQLVAVATPCKYVVISARRLTPNTGDAFIGTAATQNLFIDKANFEGRVIPIDDASKLYIKVGVNGEGVNYSIFA
jgi:hypothetical protein